MAKYIYGTAGNDILNNTIAGAIVNAYGGNDTVWNYANNVSVYGGDGHDNIGNIGNHVSIWGGNGADSIISNGNNGNIFGDAGNDTIYVEGKGNIISGGTGNDVILLNNTGGNAISSGSGNDIVYGFSANDTIAIAGSNWSQKTSGNNIVYNFSDGSLTLLNAVGIKSYTIALFGGDGKDTLIGGKGNDFIVGNAGNDTINGGDGNDSIYGNAGNDSLVGGTGNDTLIGGDGNDTLVGGKGNDVFIYSAGKDVISDYASGDKISIGSSITSSTFKGSDAIFTIGKGTLTVKKAKGKELLFVDANGKARTIIGGAQLLDNSSSSKVTIGSSVEVADASARTKAIQITGNALANTIMGGSGNDTLTGGKGNDVFIYSAGKDVISDYASGDKISIGSSITSSTFKGSDAIFTIGKGTLTVKKAKGKELLFVDANGKARTIIGGAQLLDNSSSSKVTIGSSIEVADASKRTKAIQITGNTLANSITGGNGADNLNGAAGNDKLIGGAGNDSLTGGKGDDSLWGNAGADTFIYGNGDGKDVIYGFANDDLLKITGTFSASYNKSKSEVYFKVGSTKNAITLHDFTASTFNVNSSTYKISGSKLVKK